MLLDRAVDPGGTVQPSLTILSLRFHFSDQFRAQKRHFIRKFGFSKQILGSKVDSFCGEKRIENLELENAIW